MGALDHAQRYRTLKACPVDLAGHRGQRRGACWRDTRSAAPMLQKLLSGRRDQAQIWRLFAVHLQAFFAGCVFISRNAGLQAIDSHGQMKRRHRFAMVIKIVQRAGQGGVKLIKWSGCLHGKFFSRSARRRTSYPASGTDLSRPETGPSANFRQRKCQIAPLVSKSRRTTWADQTGNSG